MFFSFVFFLLLIRKDKKKEITSKSALQSAKHIYRTLSNVSFCFVLFLFSSGFICFSLSRSRPLFLFSNSLSDLFVFVLFLFLFLISLNWMRKIMLQIRIKCIRRDRVHSTKHMEKKFWYNFYCVYNYFRSESTKSIGLSDSFQ